MKTRTSRSSLDFLLGFVITITWGLLGVCLSVCLFGCGGPSEARYGCSSSSLVSLARLERATPGISYENGEPGWASMRDKWVPHCGAFAVRRLARVQLATAAHCLVNVHRGGAVRYFQTFGLGTATVQYLDEARDVAYLDVHDSSLVPLEIGPAPALGAPVRAFSPVYDATSRGFVRAAYDEGWYETSQTIVYGWSGSPELDSLGRVVGVIAKCPVAFGAKQCTPGHALVTAL